MAFRRKRGDTKVATIERTYGLDFGVRGDMKLQTLLDRTGARTVTELVRGPATEAWEVAERAACRRRGLPHVGGSGAPDCDDGQRVVEVKHRQQPVNAGDVKRIAGKPSAQDRDVEIVSTTGFTGTAHKTARRLGVKLRRR